MGHETCGEAVELGEGADAELGALYCVHVTSTKRPGPSLFQLENCFGLGLDGGYAQFAVVPQTALVRVPEGIPPAVAAVASDAVTTAYHAASYVRPGDRVLVIGVGGLGLIGVKIAVLRGAGQVFACDIREHARELAAQAGAIRTFAPPDLATAVAEHTFNVDVVLDFVSNPATFKTAREALRQVGTETGGLGRLVIVGIGREDVTLNLTDLIFSPLEVITSVYGSKGDIAEVLDLINQNKLTVEVEEAPLGDINLVIDNLRKGNIRTRAVLIPPAVDV